MRPRFSSEKNRPKGHKYGIQETGKQCPWISRWRPIDGQAFFGRLVGQKKEKITDTAIPPGNRRRYDKKRRFVMNRR